MNTSTHYNFNLPEGSDYYDVEHANDNFETIDTELYNRYTKTQTEQRYLKIADANTTYLEKTVTVNAEIVPVTKTTYTTILNPPVVIDSQYTSQTFSNLLENTPYTVVSTSASGTLSGEVVSLDVEVFEDGSFVFHGNTGTYMYVSVSITYTHTPQTAETVVVNIVPSTAPTEV